MDVAFAILVVLLTIAMILSFVRNAVTLKRDVDKRFDDFSVRLADQAKSTVEPLLNRDPDDTTE